MSKSIKVSYFALFREKTGKSEELVTTDAETAIDLFRELEDCHGFNEPYGHCKVAINNDLAEWSNIIKDGDTVLFFPPVSGG
jgi:molybdopterin converting factor subunit 1